MRHLNDSLSEPPCLTELNCVPGLRGTSWIHTTQSSIQYDGLASGNRKDERTLYTVNGSVGR